MKICDWGGNHGNLLLDGIEANEIEPKDYTCIDVDVEVLHQSMIAYPDANWVVRPVTHPVYSTHNEDNDIDFVSMQNSFDIVYAYSVYTHDTYEKFYADLDIMHRLLKPGGIMCVSYINPVNVQVFVEKRKHEYSHSVDASVFENIVDYVYFINNDTLTRQYNRAKPCKHFITVYNDKWLEHQIARRFGNCTLDIPDLKQVKDFNKSAWHSSIIITKEDW